jgi:hypothetical protein
MMMGEAWFDDRGDEGEHLGLILKNGRQLWYGTSDQCKKLRLMGFRLLST